MIKKYINIILISFFLITPVYSAGDGSASNEGVKKLDNYKFATKQINKAKKLEKKGKIDKAEKYYKKAIKYLLKANAENPADPDTLNYLGFTHRKIGNFKDAEIYYLVGLEIAPTHKGINEYLGELYVNTNRIEKAKERLKVLEGCKCEEFEELQAAINQGISKY
tara:strand:- start:822 stop:1316 length:495 start_codon:yes stop_codon:yes gene_type:complete